MPPHPVSRRHFLAGASVAAATVTLASRGSASAAAGAPVAEPDGVDLHWLDGPPAASTGTSWGVPWPKGSVPAESTFALDADGSAVPVQSWPLAHWPDGTLKWTGHAVASSAVAASFRLTVGTPAAPASPVTANRSATEIRLGNGVVDVRIATSGAVAIRSISRGTRTTARDGRLVLLLQDHPEGDAVRTSWSGVVEGADI